MEPSNRFKANRGSPPVRSLLWLALLLLAGPVLTVEAANSPPVVSFGAPHPTDIFDNATSQPFAQITVSDPDAGDTVTVRITFPDAHGSFAVGGGLTKTAPGTYDLSALTPAAAQTFLRALSFVPAPNRIPVTENDTTTFTVRATDASSASDSGSEDSEDLTVKSFNDAPHFTGTVPAQIDDNVTATLFSGISITDVDVVRIGGNVVPQPVTVTATLLGGEGGVAFGSFPGSTLTFTDTDSSANVTASFQALVFSPVPNRKPVGITETASVTITLVDSLGASALENGARNFSILSINDPPVVSASLAPASFPDSADVLPFRLSIIDPDPFDNSFVAELLPVSDPDFDFGTFDPASPSFTGSREFVALAVQSIFYRPVKNGVAGSQTVDVRFRVTDPHGAAAFGPAQLTILGVNDQPNIVGVPATLIRMSDDETVPPFKTVTIDDPDGLGAQFVSVSITMDDAGKGTFTPAGPFNNMTPAAATVAIRAVVFTPTPNRIPVGQTETVVMTIVVTDALGLQRSNNKTTVVITSVNGAPKILGVEPLASQPKMIPPTQPVVPFAGISMEDDDTPPNVTLTITLDNAAKGVLANLGGFVEQPVGSGIYTFAGTPAAVTAALAALQFEVNSNFLFPPNAPGGTTFTLKAVDSVLNTRTETLSIVLQSEPRNHLVTRVDDDRDEGSLRHAVEVAGNDDVITFALKEYPAVLQLDKNLGPIELLRNVAFKGPGADMLSISGDSDGNRKPDVQLFLVHASVTMEGLTLTQGSAGTGGAVYVGPTGQLAMRYCAVTDCLATQWGGGIDVDQGSLSMDHCFLRGNATDAALGLGGGAVSLFTDKACSFVNTTFSANQQAAGNGFGGGALYIENFTPQSELSVTVTHCTFAENQDAADDGTSIHANVFGTRVQVKNSILADGFDKNLAVAGAGRVVSLGGNVSDDSTHTILTQGGQPKLIILFDQPTDRTEAVSILADLNQQFRPTPAYLPKSGSPAIGRAVSPAEVTDQRGVIRDNDPDSGAIELNATARLVINEIQAKGSPADFVELYVLRDSVPLNLGGYSLWVDGTKRHVFAANTTVQPGFGILVADIALTAAGIPVATPVVTPSEGSPLGLIERGRVELRTPAPDVRPVLSVAYVDVFVDPADPLQNLDFPDNALTLAPQFRGVAYLPHSIVLPPPLGGGDLSHAGATSSPGADAGNTPFGSPNAFPFAVADQVLVGEDDLLSVSVLANDLDADGLDLLFVVDVSQLLGAGGDDATALSSQGALVSIDPSAAPLRGVAVAYDPRHASALQQLSEGVEKTDEFYYSIVDIGAGPISAYQGTVGNPPTIVVSPGHRLATGAQIAISGAGTAAYNAQHMITRIDDDSFSIPVAFVDDPATKGSWVTVSPRAPTARSEAKVTLTVIGANDPPTPNANGLPDVVSTDEETILRILGDSALTPAIRGSVVPFDTDVLYPAPRQISNVSLLGNDDDIDTDDSGATLKIVGVLGSITVIADFSGTPGVAPAVVHSPAHGLAEGTRILISGYGGHPSYNGYHQITVLDGDTFSIPVLFIDDNAAKGVWAILNDGNRLSATSAKGAAVKLEIRTDRIETSIVYNPRASAYLNGLAETQTEADTFYYAVQDSHGAVSVGEVTVNVTGVNDPPEPEADPSALELLDPLLTGGRTLGQVLDQVTVQFYVPPFSGTPTRADTQVQFVENEQAQSFFLSDLWTTDEGTILSISSSDVLSNDSDVDRINVLSVSSVASPSREGAVVTLSGDKLTIGYDPRNSARLQTLAREEPIIDAFEVTITDSHGGQVTAMVAVLVIGLNDKPVAQDDVATTPEDTVLVLAPPGPVLNNDQDTDIDGSVPDNQLRLIPVTQAPTQAQGAHVTIQNNVLTYDPRGSAFLNGLGQGQTFLDSFEYTVWDGSFVFANDDLFKVQADGSDFVLNVLSNDRNFTGFPGPLQILEVGIPSQGGTAKIDATGTQIVYSPAANFVGDEVMRYTISDDLGNVDGALLTVRVTVNQLNGNLQANADHFTIAVGESPALDVLANDNIIPTTGASLTITRIVSQPSQDSVALANNQITYVQQSAGPYPYTTTFSYEVSGGGTARAMASATVQVVDRRGTLNLRADDFSVQAGSRDNSLDVLANDNILPGSPAALRIREISDSPDHGIVQINDAGDRLLYTPANGFVGEDMLTYVATDGLGGTGTGIAKISVGNLTTSSDFFAVPFDDSTKTSDDGTTDLDVLANDRVLQAAGDTITITGVVPTSSTVGVMSVAPGNGMLRFDPAADREGEQEFTYTIKDGSTPGRTAEGKVTVLVAREGVKANPDFFAVGVEGSGNELDVLINDRAIPDRGRELTIVELGSGINRPNHGGTVTVNESNNRLLYTPALGFIGEETFTYVMTDSRKTDTAKVVVRVSSGALLANNDAFTVFFEPVPVGAEPRQFTLSVLANDRVLPDNGQVLTITGIGIDHTPVSNAPDRQGKVEIAADGATLLYTPLDTDGPFPYVERFTYELSDGTARREDAVVMIEVQRRSNAREMETNDDAFTVESDSQANILQVLANDEIKPATADAWAITGISVPAFGGIVAVSGPNILYTPQPGFVGTDQFSYTVSDGLGGTGSANVAVKVGDLPVCNDVFSAISGSANNELDVLANDAIRPGTAANFKLLNATGTDKGGSVVISNGKVLYSASPTYAGPYPYLETFSYSVEDKSLGTVTGRVYVSVHQAGSDRDTGLLQITVVGVNDPPVISGTVAGQTVYAKSAIKPFAGVTITEVDHVGLPLPGAPQPLTITVAFDGTHGFLTTLSGGFAQVSPGLYRATGVPVQTATDALRALSFVPTTGNRVTPTVSETTTFTLTVNDLIAPPVTDNITTVTAIHALVERIQTLFSGSNSQNFGQPVAVGGDVLVVGAPFEKHGTAHPSGSAFIFSRHQGGMDNWGLVKEISAPDGVAGDQFGFSAGVDGDTIVIGTPKDNDAGKSSGSAYIFQRDAGGPNNWGFIKKLQPASSQSGDDFGFAAAMSGDTIAVGAHLHDNPNSNGGAVYVFYRNQGGANQWGEVKKVTAPDVANSDEFGYSVSLSGDYLIAGTPFDDDKGNNSGTASVFERNQGGANNWGRIAKLVPADLAAGNQFGLTVSVSGGLAAVGAPFHSVGANSLGAAYVFERGTGSWSQLKKITAADGASGDQFGTAVGLSGENVVIGARFDDDVASNAGSAYVFGRNYNPANPAVPTPGSWAQIEKFLPLTVISGGHFGFSVSISGSTVVVGSDFDGGSPGDTTYLYRLKFNNAPLITEPIVDQVVVVGSPFNFTFPASTFTDADLTELLTLTASRADGSSLPAWLTFNPITRTFSGTPGAGDVGSVSIKVTATDLDVASVSDIFDTKVNSVALLRVRVVREDPRFQKASFAAEYDGRTNLHRYAFGTDATSDGASEAAPVLGIIRYGDTGHLFVTYIRRVNDPRVHYVIEGTDDLLTWKSAQSRFAEVLSSTVDDEFERVITVLADDETTASPTQFFRIRAVFGQQQ